METNPLVLQLRMMQSFFNKTIENLEEADSGYKPEDGAMTVVQQVAHTAQTVDWFTDGTFDDNGYAMNFEEAMNEIFACTSLNEAKDWFNKSVEKAVDIFGSKTGDELNAPIKGEIMAGMPRIAAVPSLADHTAHHRGSLAVYSRMLGKPAPMPYGDM